MALYDMKKLLSENSYPGRGIVVGKSSDGKKALIAYFIMGRSENSRNRIFERFEGGMRTKAFDESKLSDPSLIIYNPYLAYGNIDIVTNGDQTNTIFDEIVKCDGKDAYAFEKALCTREFEPDAPNFTPRISSAIIYENCGFSYKLSILKSANGRDTACNRFTYFYQTPENGIGHFIHTYRCDGNPIPSFYGEPEEVELPSSCKELADMIWENLNPDNKVSLFVRSVELKSGKTEEIIINKNK